MEIHVAFFIVDPLTTLFEEQLVAPITVHISACVSGRVHLTISAVSPKLRKKQFYSQEGSLMIDTDKQ